MQKQLNLTNLRQNLADAFVELEEDDDRPVCSVCGLAIADDEQSCWGHEDDCPNAAEPGSVDCECDLIYHSVACCPVCNADELRAAASVERLQELAAVAAAVQS